MWYFGCGINHNFQRLDIVTFLGFITQGFTKFNDGGYRWFNDASIHRHESQSNPLEHTTSHRDVVNFQIS